MTRVSYGWRARIAVIASVVLVSALGACDVGRLSGEQAALPNSERSWRFIGRVHFPNEVLPGSTVDLYDPDGAPYPRPDDPTAPLRWPIDPTTGVFVGSITTHTPTGICGARLQIKVRYSVAGGAMIESPFQPLLDPATCESTVEAATSDIDIELEITVPAP